MNGRPLTHDDAMALTRGSLPQDRPDLVALALAIDDFRQTFTEPAPQPSATLIAWMTGSPALPPHGVGTTLTVATPVHTRTGSLRRWTRTATRALAGLGVTMKIALGGTAALAAVATAGAIGVLPGGPQAVFDRILDDNRTDAPPPGPPPTPATPADDAGTGARHHHEHRLPTADTSEPQGGRVDGSQDVTGEPARDMNTPAPEREEENHTETDDERLKDPADDSDGEPNEESDEGLSSQDSNDGPKRSQDEDAEQTDGSGGDAVDVSGSGTDSHDAQDHDAATEGGGSNE